MGGRMNIYAPGYRVVLTALYGYLVVGSSLALLVEFGQLFTQYC